MTTEAAARTRLRQSLRREWRFTWRYAYNLPAVIEYHRTRPELTPGAARMAEDLVAHGVAVGSVDDLMPTDTELFDRAGQAARDLLARPSGRRGGSQEERRHDDDQVLRARAAGSEPHASTPTSPIVQMAMHEQLRGLLEQYVHMHLRLHDLNVWLNLPSGEAPQLSQRWHRDEPDDRHILKAFIYLRDVTEGSGPLAYVRGSHRAAGRKAHLPATWDGYGFRVEDDDDRGPLRRRPGALGPRAGRHHRRPRHPRLPPRGLGGRRGAARDDGARTRAAPPASARLIRPGPGVDPDELERRRRVRRPRRLTASPRRPPRLFTRAKQTRNLTSVRSPPWLRWPSSAGPTRPRRVHRCERPAGRGCCCWWAASLRPNRSTIWRTGSVCPVSDADLRARIDWLTRRLAPPASPRCRRLDEDGLLHSGGRWVSLPPVEARLAPGHARALRRGRQPRRARPSRMAPGRARAATPSTSTCCASAAASARSAWRSARCAAVATCSSGPNRSDLALRNG